MENTENKERVEVLNDIITGIARRCSYKFKTLSAEDLSQELWLRLLESKDVFDKNLDLNLVAVICYRKIVDIQRFEMKRNHYSLEDFDTSLYSADDSIESDIMINGLFESFPEGSKERTFLEYWGASANIGLGKDKFTPNDENTYKGGFTDKDLAHVLGYTSYTHRGYRDLRKRMREFVADYFDLIKLL